jgi:hypothetical protein
MKMDVSGEPIAFCGLIQKIGFNIGSICMIVSKSGVDFSEAEGSNPIGYFFRIQSALVPSDNPTDSNAFADDVRASVMESRCGCDERTNVDRCRHDSPPNWFSLWIFTDQYQTIAPPSPSQF